MTFRVISWRVVTWIEPRLVRLFERQNIMSSPSGRRLMKHHCKWEYTERIEMHLLRSDYSTCLPCACCVSCPHVLASILRPLPLYLFLPGPSWFTTLPISYTSRSSCPHLIPALPSSCLSFICFLAMLPSPCPPVTYVRAFPLFLSPLFEHSETLLCIGSWNESEN